MACVLVLSEGRKEHKRSRYCRFCNRKWPTPESHFRLDAVFLAGLIFGAKYNRGQSRELIIHSKTIRQFTRHFAVLLFGVVVLPAAAFQPLITDDTGTQGALGNQFEFAFDRDRIRMAGNTTGVRTLPFTATRGLTDSQDIFLGISHVRSDGNAPGSNASGSGNPVLGAKWRLLETADSKTSIGFKPEFVLPVSATREAAGLGTGRASWNLTLIVTQEIPFGAVHANLATGRNRFRDSAAPEITRLASVARDWDVMPKWKLALDAGVVSAKVGGVKMQSRFIELGAIHSLSDALDFALEFVRARDSAVPPTNTDRTTIGVTWRF